MILSNSDVGTYQTCQMKFVFAKSYGLQKAKLDDPLRKGLTGHKMLQRANEAQVAGTDWYEAMQKVALDTAMSGDPGSAGVISKDMAFYEYALEQGWEPVEIEKANFVELPQVYGVTFAFTPDVIYRGTKGPTRGQLFIVDYKHIGQYWSDNMVRLFIQALKYIAYKRLQPEFKSMRSGAVAMLNTRTDNKGESFRFKWIPGITPYMLDRVRYENEEALKEVAQFAMLPVDQQRQLAVRTVNNSNCKYCPFADDICPMDFAGHDISRTMRENYVQNTYGYEESPNDVRISG